MYSNNTFPITDILDSSDINLISPTSFSGVSFPSPIKITTSWFLCRMRIFLSKYPTISTPEPAKVITILYIVAFLADMIIVHQVAARNGNQSHKRVSPAYLYEKAHQDLSCNISYKWSWNGITYATGKESLDYRMVPLLYTMNIKLHLRFHTQSISVLNKVTSRVLDYEILWVCFCTVPMYTENKGHTSKEDRK